MEIKKYGVKVPIDATLVIFYFSIEITQGIILKSSRIEF